MSSVQFARRPRERKARREFSAGRDRRHRRHAARYRLRKSARARTIAVATGTWSREKLAEHYPDILIDDLSDVTVY